MKQETIDKAQKVLAMLNILQEAIDELAEDKAFFRHELKMTGKAFARELEKQITEWYTNMGREGELYFQPEIDQFQKLVRGYLDTFIEPEQFTKAS